MPLSKSVEIAEHPSVKKIALECILDAYHSGIEQEYNHIESRHFSLGERRPIDFVKMDVARRTVRQKDAQFGARKLWLGGVPLRAQADHAGGNRLRWRAGVPRRSLFANSICKEFERFKRHLL